VVRARWHRGRPALYPTFHVAAWSADAVACRCIYAGQGFVCTSGLVRASSSVQKESMHACTLDPFRSRLGW
jgi:hypothetical protein